MLFLNENDIKKAVSMKDIINGIDESYRIYEKNEFKMPLRTQVREKDNTLLLMPCLTKNAMTTKLVTVFPKNTDIPTLHGLVILNCGETGKINALIEGSFLTGLRTGAIGGSATRHLASKQAKSLAVIGAGVQGLYQTIAVCTERNIKDIYIYSRTASKIPSFIKKLQDWLDTDINMHIVNSTEDALNKADIVVTATTSSDPVLPNDETLLKGKLFIGVGSFQPSMREFSEALYKVTDHTFIDTKDAIEESGDIIDPIKNGWINKESVQTLSSFLQQNDKTPSHKENSIIFKSTGMALFDAVVANLIYEKALQHNVGTKLTL